MVSSSMRLPCGNFFSSQNNPLIKAKAESSRWYCISPLTNRKRTLTFKLQDHKGWMRVFGCRIWMQVAQGCGYGRSLFERLHGVGHPVNLLDVQYRMHPEISMFPNAQFYGGKIQDGNNVWKGRYNTEACQQIFSGPYKFINIQEGREQRDVGQTKSWKNLLEVEIVVLLISRIQKGQ